MIRRLASSRSTVRHGGVSLGSSAWVPTRSNATRLFAANATVTTFDLPDPAVVIAAGQRHSIPLTKIVATVGPTSEQAEPLRLCVQAGLHSMRLNFSHATPEEVELRCTNLNQAVTALTPSGNATQDVVSVLLDTKGPELRTGKLLNDVSGHDTVELVAGKVVMEKPRYEVVADTFTHLAHHRGQLTVYLRLNDAQVPAIYGPSADDASF